MIRTVSRETYERVEAILSGLSGPRNAAADQVGASAAMARLDAQRERQAIAATRNRRMAR